MKIVWFVSNVYEDNGRYTSDLASVRLRCIEPAYSMVEVGNKSDVRIITLDSGGNVTLNPDDFKDVDLVVFGKIFSTITPLLDFIKKQGVPIVADICDDILSLKHLSKPYESLCKYASALIVSTEPLVRLLKKAYPDKKIYLVSDMIEGNRLECKKVIFSRDNIKLGWFGQPNNLSPLNLWLADLSNTDYSFSLDIVTREDEFTKNWLQKARAQFPKIALSLIPWSMQNQTDMLSAVDLVLIPSSEEQSKAVKTANRVVTCLWSGTPLIAYPVPSYQAFDAVIPITPNVVQALEWWSQQEDLSVVISQAQQKIESLFGREKLANEWFDVLKLCTLIEPVVWANNVTLTNQIRLNLGCGDKILPGYVNVDLVDERAGNKPDIQCDIRNLTVFENDHADEVITVHVIEHFYYWEAAEVLNEWVRVLKPGGKMVIECPNLISACEEVLKNPDQATGPGPEGQRTMWVFYGDPLWRDPLMCHKWLYTPQSLAKLMAHCGLKNIRQEAAQFKLREPRDMRLVGIKA